VTSFCLALPTLALLASGASGLFFEQLTLSSAGGRAAGAGVRSRVWHSGQRMRLEAGAAGAGPALILQLDRGKAYRLDPETRTATELDAERLRTRAQLDAGMAGDLMGFGAAPARSAPLAGAARTIAGHPCRGFRISAGSAILHVYVATDLPLGVEAFAAFLEWSGAGVSLGGLLEEIRKLPGFPLETRARVEVLGVEHETVSTVTRLELGPQPAERFEPPPGWRVVAE
jgi:hypothetical protein